ncbi:MAG TPA: DUF2252 domain-containing protein [Casimicrobiaceae bacterium]|nr:DUF2252 domain-containing protein [Casimicrobiaceae bacterium]
MTKPNARKSVAADAEAAFQFRAERLAVGKALRNVVPRESHGRWRAPARRRDPIDLLEESSRGRLPELIPIRYGRMVRSPFTFLRGSAGLMAYDLSTTPVTGLRVQACGDCHLLNFGMFATPERNLVFDINDFDETLPAPWEWDVKRLAASFVVAARDNRLGAKGARAAAIECVRAYRENLRRFSKMTPLELWYDRLDFATIVAKAPDARARAFRQRLEQKARSRIGDYLFPKIAEPVDGRHRLIDQPPVLFHHSDPDTDRLVADAMRSYRSSLPEERRVLLDRYRLEDVAIKVVGIGSVGTRCLVGLFFSADGHPLLLQFKEARQSVLEPYAGKSEFPNHGQRVVVGQRLTQSSSDIFLGWTRSLRGFDFFGRQLRDMKMSFPVEGLTAVQLMRYAEGCGWTLARSHAKSGDAAMISGYLGKSGVFDRAIGEFAETYADQTERDHARLAAAVSSGRIEAIVEDDL